MKELKVGDRVRLKGFANIAGESLPVDGLKAKVTGPLRFPGRVTVVLLRPDEQGAYECEVYPSQCRRLVRRERRRVWIQHRHDGTINGVATEPPSPKTGVWTEFREVRRK